MNIHFIIYSDMNGRHSQACCKLTLYTTKFMLRWIHFFITTEYNQSEISQFKTKKDCATKDITFGICNVRKVNEIRSERISNCNIIPSHIGNKVGIRRTHDWLDYSIITCKNTQGAFRWLK